MHLATRTDAGALDRLGRSPESRRFLLSLLLVSHHHLISRPWSFANDRIFDRMADYCRQLLDVLREPGWPLLDDTTEQGIQSLDLIPSWSVGPKERARRAAAFGQTYRRHFRALNVPWSALAPVPRLTLDDWPQPAHVLVAAGSNIGIGDEVLFFRAARRIRHHFPRARFEVLSYHPTLWDHCAFADVVTYPVHDQLATYGRAVELLQADPGALVVFTEFAAAPMYRHLETLPGLHRFLYLDTGAALARCVDQQGGAIAEYRARTRASNYAMLEGFLDDLGVAPADAALQVEPGLRARLAVPDRDRPLVFVNPFSSKDPSVLTPAWWAAVLNFAGARQPLDVQLFAGINEESRAFARGVAAQLDPACCAPSCFGDDGVASLGDTVKAALRSDLILGLDTFTSHTATLERVPSVTLFYGSEWHPWRVPGPHALHATVHDEPEEVGRLVCALLIPPPPCARARLEALDARAARLVADARAGCGLHPLLGGLDECRTLARAFAREAPDQAGAFTDLSPSYLDFLEAALRRALHRGEGADAAAGGLLRRAMEQWQECNFARYLAYWARRDAPAGDPPSHTVSLSLVCTQGKQFHAEPQR